MKSHCSPYSLLRLTVITMAAMLSSCSAINEDYSPCPSEEESIKFHIKLTHAISTTPRSRADNSHPLLPAESYEKAIDIAGGDFRIYIFDLREGNNERLVFASELDSRENIIGGTALTGYTLHATVAPEALTDLQENPNAIVKLRVAMVANLESAGGKYPTGVKVYDSETPTVNPTTFNDLFGNNIGVAGGQVNYATVTPSFDLPDLDKWDPTEGKGFIPVYGYNDYSIPARDLLESYFLEPVMVAPLPLLRALCRLEVVDALPKAGGDYPRIKDVSISGICNLGQIMPTSDPNYDPTLTPEPINPEIVTLPAAYAENLNGTRTFKEATGVNLSLEEGGEIASYNVMRCYLPEQSFNFAGTNAKVTVTITGLNAAGQPEDKSYTIDVSFKPDVWSQWDNYFFRNHIYRFVITSVSGELDIRYVVCDWVDREVTIPPFS